MYSTIYWLTRLDALHEALQTLCIICCIVIGCVVIFGFMIIDTIDDDDIFNGKTLRKIVKWCVGVGLIAGTALVFTPTKNEALLIFAGGKAYEYVKSDTSLQKLPYQTTEYLKLILDKEIQEIKKEAKD